MTRPIQQRTRMQIRQSIGYNLDDVIIGTASAAGTTTTLIDTYGLAKGGDNEYKGRQLLITSPAATTGIAAGSKSWVTGSIGDTKTIVLQPAFSTTVASGDAYELWKVFTKEEVDEAINQAIIEGSDDSLLVRQDSTIYTEWDRYEYPISTSFVGIHTIEYADIKEGEILEDCEAVWTSGNPFLTATVDDEKRRNGSYCNKLVISADISGAATRLTYKDITSADLSNYDTVDLWMHANVAIAASTMFLALDDSAGCLTPVESINLPALTANTWTRHSVSLANPHLDTAIVSVGLHKVAAATLPASYVYLDYIVAYKARSIIWKPLNPLDWELVKGSLNYLKLTPHGRATCSNNAQLRVTGYQIPTLLSADATVSTIDPAWIIARATGRLLIGHAKSPQLDIQDRANLSKYWLGEAESRLINLRTQVISDTRWV